MKVDQFQETKSGRKNFLGKIETFIRKTRQISFAFFYIFIVVVALICLGSALGVATFWYAKFSSWQPKFINLYWWRGLSLATSFFVYGISLMVVSPTANFILGLKKLVRPFRGNVYSLESMAWYLHNALIYIVRYTFLEFVTPSPLNILFYRAMGMKIGKGVVINTTNISDACLIELDDYVTIGGSAHLLTHYSQSGYLVLSTLKIGRKSTIGLKATVFGNVVIGENCTVRAGSVVLPKTRLESNSSY